MGLVSFTEFAKQQGISQAMVSKLFKAGRLVTVVKEGRKKPLIDSVASEKLIASTTDFARAENGANAKPGVKSKAVEKFIDASDLDGEIKRSRAHEAEYRALQTELDFKKESGELVDAQLVKVAVASIAVELRQGLERMPDRLADKLCLMVDPLEVHKFLAVQFDELMKDVSASIFSEEVLKDGE